MSLVKLLFRSFSYYSSLCFCVVLPSLYFMPACDPIPDCDDAPPGQLGVGRYSHCRAEARSQTDEYNPLKLDSSLEIVGDPQGRYQDGSELNPYRISTPRDLIAFRDDYNNVGNDNNGGSLGRYSGGAVNSFNNGPSNTNDLHYVYVYFISDLLDFDSQGNTDWAQGIGTEGHPFYGVFNFNGQNPPVVITMRGLAASLFGHVRGCSGCSVINPSHGSGVQSEIRALKLEPRTGTLQSSALLAVKASHTSISDITITPRGNNFTLNAPDSTPNLAFVLAEATEAVTLSSVRVYGISPQGAQDATTSLEPILSGPASCIGALVGKLGGGSRLSESFADFRISGGNEQTSLSASRGIGSLAGCVSDSTITQSYAVYEGTLRGTADAPVSIGGLVGEIAGASRVENSFVYARNSSGAGGAIPFFMDSDDPNIRMGALAGSALAAAPTGDAAPMGVVTISSSYAYLDGAPLENTPPNFGLFVGYIGATPGAASTTGRNILDLSSSFVDMGVASPNISLVASCVPGFGLSASGSLYYSRPATSSATPAPAFHDTCNSYGEGAVSQTLSTSQVYAWSSDDMKHKLYEHLPRTLSLNNAKGLDWRSSTSADVAGWYNFIRPLAPSNSSSSSNANADDDLGYSYPCLNFATASQQDTRMREGAIPCASSESSTDTGNANPGPPANTDPPGTIDATDLNSFHLGSLRGKAANSTEYLASGNTRNYTDSYDLAMPLDSEYNNTSQVFYQLQSTFTHRSGQEEIEHAYFSSSCTKDVCVSTNPVCGDNVADPLANASVCIQGLPPTSNTPDRLGQLESVNYELRVCALRSNRSGFIAEDRQTGSGGELLCGNSVAEHRVSVVDLGELDLSANLVGTRFFSLDNASKLHWPRVAGARTYKISRANSDTDGGWDTLYTWDKDRDSATDDCSSFTASPSSDPVLAGRDLSSLALGNLTGSGGTRCAVNLAKLNATDPSSTEATTFGALDPMGTDPRFRLEVCIRPDSELCLPTLPEATVRIAEGGYSHLSPSFRYSPRTSSADPQVSLAWNSHWNDPSQNTAVGMGGTRRFYCLEKGLSYHSNQAVHADRAMVEAVASASCNSTSCSQVSYSVHDNLQDSRFNEALAGGLRYRYSLRACTYNLNLEQALNETDMDSLSGNERAFCGNPVADTLTNGITSGTSDAIVAPGSIACGQWSPALGEDPAPEIRPLANPQTGRQSASLGVPPAAIASLDLNDPDGRDTGYRVSPANITSYNSSSDVLGREVPPPRLVYELQMTGRMDGLATYQLDWSPESDQYVGTYQLQRCTFECSLSGNSSGQASYISTCPDLSQTLDTPLSCDFGNYASPCVEYTRGNSYLEIIPEAAYATRGNVCYEYKVSTCSSHEDGTRFCASELPGSGSGTNSIIVRADRGDNSGGNSSQHLAPPAVFEPRDYSNRPVVSGDPYEVSGTPDDPYVLVWNNAEDSIPTAYSPQSYYTNYHAIQESPSCSSLNWGKPLHVSDSLSDSSSHKSDGDSTTATMLYVRSSSEDSEPPGAELYFDASEKPGGDYCYRIWSCSGAWEDAGAGTCPMPIASDLVKRSQVHFANYVQPISIEATLRTTEDDNVGHSFAGYSYSSEVPFAGAESNSGAHKIYWKLQPYIDYYRVDRTRIDLGPVGNYTAEAGDGHATVYNSACADANLASGRRDNGWSDWEQVHVFDATTPNSSNSVDRDESTYLFHDLTSLDSGFYCYRVSPCASRGSCVATLSSYAHAEVRAPGNTGTSDATGALAGMTAASPFALYHIVLPDIRGENAIYAETESSIRPEFSWLHNPYSGITSYEITSNSISGNLSKPASEFRCTSTYDAVGNADYSSTNLDAETQALRIPSSGGVRGIPLPTIETRITCRIEGDNPPLPMRANLYNIEVRNSGVSDDRDITMAKFLEVEGTCSGGSGEALALIVEPRDLELIRSNPNPTCDSDSSEFNGFNGYKLSNNIDLSSYSCDWVPIGAHDRPFEVVFDGGGHTIENLCIYSDANHVGLFGYADGASIRNVTLSNVELRVSASSDSTPQSQYVGALLGQGINTMLGSTSRSACGTSSIRLENSSTSSQRGGHVVGGLVGSLQSPQAHLCNLHVSLDGLGSLEAVQTQSPGAEGYKLGGIFGNLELAASGRITVQDFSLSLNELRYRSTTPANNSAGNIAIGGFAGELSLTHATGADLTIDTSSGTTNDIELRKALRLDLESQATDSGYAGSVYVGGLIAKLTQSGANSGNAIRIEKTRVGIAPSTGFFSYLLDRLLNVVYGIDIDINLGLGQSGALSGSIYTGALLGYIHSDAVLYLGRPGTQDTGVQIEVDKIDIDLTVPSLTPPPSTQEDMDRGIFAGGMLGWSRLSRFVLDGGTYLDIDASLDLSITAPATPGSTSTLGGDGGYALGGLLAYLELAGTDGSSCDATLVNLQNCALAIHASRIASDDLQSLVDIGSNVKLSLSAQNLHAPLRISGLISELRASETHSDSASFYLNSGSGTGLRHQALVQIGGDISVETDVRGNLGNTDSNTDISIGGLGAKLQVTGGFYVNSPDASTTSYRKLLELSGNLELSPLRTSSPFASGSTNASFYTGLLAASLSSGSSIGIYNAGFTAEDISLDVHLGSSLTGSIYTGGLIGNLEAPSSVLKLGTADTPIRVSLEDDFEVDIDLGGGLVRGDMHLGALLARANVLRFDIRTPSGNTALVDIDGNLALELEAQASVSASAYGGGLVGSLATRRDEDECSPDDSRESSCAVFVDGNSAPLLRLGDDFIVSIDVNDGARTPDPEHFTGSIYTGGLFGSLRSGGDDGRSTGSLRLQRSGSATTGSLVDIGGDLFVLADVHNNLGAPATRSTLALGALAGSISVTGFLDIDGKQSPTFVSIGGDLKIKPRSGGTALARSVYADFYLGALFGLLEDRSSNNSNLTLQNISVSGSSLGLELSSQNDLHANFYVGGLAGKLSGGALALSGLSLTLDNQLLLDISGANQGENSSVQGSAYLGALAGDISAVGDISPADDVTIGGTASSDSINVSMDSLHMTLRSGSSLGIASGDGDSFYLGALAGRLQAGASVDSINMSNTQITVNGQARLDIDGRTGGSSALRASSYLGGLIGNLDASSALLSIGNSVDVDLDSLILDVNGVSTSNPTDTDGAFFLGGFFGKAVLARFNLDGSSHVDIGDDLSLALSTSDSATGSVYVGGLVAYLQATAEDEADCSSVHLDNDINIRSDNCAIFLNSNRVAGGILQPLVDLGDDLSLDINVGDTSGSSDFSGSVYAGTLFGSAQSTLGSLRIYRESPIGGASHQPMLRLADDMRLYLNVRSHIQGMSSSSSSTLALGGLAGALRTREALVLAGRDTTPLADGESIAPFLRVGGDISLGPKRGLSFISGSNVQASAYVGGLAGLMHAGSDLGSSFGGSPLSLKNLDIMAQTTALNLALPSNASWTGSLYAGGLAGQVYSGASTLGELRHPVTLSLSNIDVDASVHNMGTAGNANLSSVYVGGLVGDWSLGAASDSSLAMRDTSLRLRNSSGLDLNLDAQGAMNGSVYAGGLWGRLHNAAPLGLV